MLKKKFIPKSWTLKFIFLSLKTAKQIVEGKTGPAATGVTINCQEDAGNFDKYLE